MLRSVLSRNVCCSSATFRFQQDSYTVSESDREGVEVVVELTNGPVSRDVIIGMYGLNFKSVPKSSLVNARIRINVSVIKFTSLYIA